MTRSEDELVEGLEHVSYELWMLVQTTSHLSGLQHSTFVRSRAFDNALLESMLLHTRSLIEFFLGKRSRSDDLHRLDFSAEWTPAPASAVALVKADRVRLHKHLSHLTWQRFDDETQSWDVWALANAIVQIADEWSKHLRSEGRDVLHAALRPVVDEALKTLGATYPMNPDQPRPPRPPGP